MELKPCPFCGKDDDLEYGLVYSEEKDEDELQPVWCNRCGFWDWSGSHEITKWNTRPLEDALQAKWEREETHCVELLGDIENLMKERNTLQVKLDDMRRILNKAQIDFDPSGRADIICEALKQLEA